MDPEKLNSMEHGGVAVVRGRRVIKLDTFTKTAYLNDGSSLKYEKCLVATGMNVTCAKIIISKFDLRI